MPGLLNPHACCPCCGEPLIALGDETTLKTIKRVYYHQARVMSSSKGPRKPVMRWRRRPCKRVFSTTGRRDLQAARLERAYLERRA
jgi:hypothetical protein